MDKASDFGSEDLWCVSFRGRTILDIFEVMGMAGHPAIDSDESFFTFCAALSFSGAFVFPKRMDKYVYT